MKRLSSIYSEKISCPNFSNSKESEFATRDFQPTPATYNR